LFCKRPDWFGAFAFLAVHGFIVFPDMRCTKFSQSLQDNPPASVSQTVINGNEAGDRATFAHRASPGAK
jgi:hypothetical protein